MYPVSPTAYDRAITVFSPDGRLFQVEYAREAVKRGTTAVGVVYKEGVLLVVDKNITTMLIVPKSIEKIFQIDRHIGAAASGLVADARRLVDIARVEAQRHRIVYGVEMGVEHLARKVCDIKQLYTQYAGARPFGASLLIAGYDLTGPRLFETDPSGALTEYYATAIGAGKEELEEFFEREFRKGLGFEEALLLALKGLKRVAKQGLKIENMDAAKVDKEGFSFIPKQLLGEAIAKV